MKPDKPTPEGRKAEKILRQAVAKVIEKNRRLGLPVAVMYNGKAAFVSAEKALAAARKSHKSSARKSVQSKIKI